MLVGATRIFLQKTRRKGMNLTNFLKQTDALTAQYSTEQLIAFIHDIGRGSQSIAGNIFWKC